MRNAAATEDVIESLRLVGYDCRFDRGGDVQPGWFCLAGDQAAGNWRQVSLAGPEDGPIERAGVYVNLGSELDPVGPDELDLHAADAFLQAVSFIVPDEHRPERGEMLGGVQRNSPVDLGGGWFLGFDRNMVSRSMSVVYAPTE